MFVAARVLDHGVDVDASLVGERALADIRLAVVVIDVGDLAEEAGEVHQLHEIVATYRLITHLQFQVGQDGAQVGVAAALAIAVKRSLHLHRAPLHGHEGIGHAHASIVVRVDAKGQRNPLGNLFDDLAHLASQGTAISIAEHQNPRSTAFGGQQGLDRVIGVGLIAVEKVLGVVDHLAAVRDQIGDRVLDQLQIFF